MGDKEIFKKILDGLNPPQCSNDFESKLNRDWSRLHISVNRDRNIVMNALALARPNLKLSVFLISFLLFGAVLVGQKLINAQDDELERIDPLSELSLSTL